MSFHPDSSGLLGLVTRHENCARALEDVNKRRDATRLVTGLNLKVVGGAARAVEERLATHLTTHTL